MSTKKKIKIFSAMVSLLYCLTLIQGTIAKYTTSANANTDFSIARWNILINNQDVIENSNFTNTIVPVFDGTSTIKENVIAPTSEGYFDLILDGTDTDVSFDYTITIEPLDASTISDLVISKYVIGETEYSYNSNIQGTIYYDDLVKTKTIRIYMKWNDDELTETMNNEADTEATISGNATYSINVNIIQKRTT